MARYQIVYGAHILVEDGETVTQDQLLATWDPFTFAILTEVAGHVKFQDMKEGVTYTKKPTRLPVSPAHGGRIRRTKRNSRVWKSANASNKVPKTYQMPVRANLMVNDGENV